MRFGIPTGKHETRDFVHRPNADRKCNRRATNNGNGFAVIVATEKIMRRGGKVVVVVASQNNRSGIRPVARKYQ
jgi:hypothetical protein